MVDGSVQNCDCLVSVLNQVKHRGDEEASVPYERRAGFDENFQIVFRFKRPNGFVESI